MASPKTAVSRMDLALTFAEFSAAMNRQRYIGHLVFPPLYTQKQSSKFPVIPAEAALPPVEDTKRAPKGEYARDDFEWEQDEFATDDHGVEEVLDDRLLAMYPEINAEMIARDRGVTRVAQAYEYAAASLAFDTSYFTGASYTTALATAWSIAATADPIGDIDTIRETFITTCGVEPNALVIERKGLIAAIRTDRVEDLVRYTGRLDDKTIAALMPQLREVFQLEKIIVARSTVVNTAGRGQDPTYSRMWNQTRALLCRIDDGPDIENREPYLGRTLMWSEDAGPAPGADEDGISVIVEDYREERRRGGVIRVRTDYQIKRIYKRAGHLITNVTA